MDVVLRSFGILAVVGMPLGLLVVGVLVLRSGVRGGLRLGTAVALATLAIAVLSYGTALTRLEIAGKLNQLSSCDSAAECAREERMALDDTPIRPLGRWLVIAAIADGALLALWFQRGARHSAGAPTGPLAGVVGAAALFGVAVGALAWQLPLYADALADDLEVRSHVEQGILGMIACLIAIAGVVLTVQRTPIRRPGPWYVPQGAAFRRAPLSPAGRGRP